MHSCTSNALPVVIVTESLKRAPRSDDRVARDADGRRRPGYCGHMGEYLPSREGVARRADWRVLQRSPTSRWCVVL